MFSGRSGQGMTRPFWTSARIAPSRSRIKLPTLALSESEHAREQASRACGSRRHPEEPDCLAARTQNPGTILLLLIRFCAQVWYVNCNHQLCAILNSQLRPAKQSGSNKTQSATSSAAQKLYFPSRTARWFRKEPSSAGKRFLSGRRTADRNLRPEMGVQEHSFAPHPLPFVDTRLIAPAFEPLARRHRLR